MLKRSFLTALATVGLALGLTAAPASAQPVNVLLGNYNLCAGSQCMNDQNGSGEGSNVQFWNYGGIGEPNNDWNIWLAGDVECAPNSFPFFTTDSALLTLCNNSYLGAEVLKFAWAPNGAGSGFCVQQGFGITGFDMTLLEGCVPAGFDSSTTQYFIYNTQTDHVVNTALTAESYENGADNIIWLTTCGNNTESNGTGVCLLPKSLVWLISNKP